MAVSSGRGYGKLFPVDNNIFVEISHEGLCRIQDGTATPVLLQRIPEDPVIQGVFRLHGNLVVVAADSFYQIDNSGLQKWKTSVLQSARALAVIPLRNGELAVGTSRSGLLLIDGRGNLSRIVSKSQELRSDFVKSVYEDRQGGVWLALDRGIARVEVQQASTVFREEQGMPEMVVSLARHNGTLYAGTAVGLSSLSPSRSGDPPHFQAIPDVRQGIITLLSTSHGLLAGGTAGIWEVDRNQATPLEPTHHFVYDLTLSRKNPEIVFAAGADGLAVLRWQSNTWKQIAKVGTDGDEFRTVVEDDDGRVWVSSRSSISRIDWQQSPARISRFGSNQGVSDGLINGYRIGGVISFATAHGLRKFDEVHQRFVPDDRFGKDFSDGTRPVSLVRQNANGDIWVSGSGYHGILSPQGPNTYSWTLDPLAQSDIKELYALYFDPDATVFASGGDGGLTRFKPSGAASPFKTPVLVRQVEGLASSRRFFGGETKNQELPKFRHADNALRFSFALPTFGDESQTVYQVWLQGFDGNGPHGVRRRRRNIQTFSRRHINSVCAHEL